MKIVEQQTSCLDKGFIRLIAVGGDDEFICKAARVSYANTPKRAQSDDAKLIDYLMEHMHTSPFEQVVYWFHCKMPIFIARQWIRHRTGRVNEMSARYSELPNEFYVPDAEQLRKQSKTNNQGRSDELVDAADIMCKKLELHNTASYNLYSDLLEEGLSRELSRTVLPVNIYTEWYWQMDLHNLLHFVNLRADSHAQYEIRVYAEAICKFIEQHNPLTWQAFTRHIRDAVKFSAVEIEALREYMDRFASREVLDNFYRELSIRPEFSGNNNRKIDAFRAKIEHDLP